MSAQSFSSSLGTLNSFREDYRLGRNLSLKDFMIDPVIVEDTLIEHPNTSQADTTITKRVYDYRGMIDSLVCRYIFEGEYAFDNISNNGGEVEIASLKFGHTMYLESGRYAASGAIGIGGKYLNLIETNSSKLQTQWVTAGVERQDIRVTNGWIHILVPRHEFGFNEMVKRFQNYGNEDEKE